MDAPELQHYDEFKKILTGYKISANARKVINNLQLVLLIGPFASGRNTLINELLKTGDYYYIVSDTTRPPQVRDGKMEEHGRQYFFRREQEVLEDLKKGEFLEAELLHEQQVSGISIRELEKAELTDKIAITDVELAGIDNVRSVKPDVVSIMLLPPSFEEWQKRVVGRGKMAAKDYERRMRSAIRIFEACSQKDYFQFVIAENVSKSVAAIDAIAAGGESPYQQRGKQLVKQLLEKTKKVMH